MGKMGKGRKRRNNKVNPFAQRKRDNRDAPKERQVGPYTLIVRENQDFEDYYKHQKICPEDEWESFIATMKKDLPVTFRVTSFRGESERLVEIIKDKLFVDYVEAAEELTENDEEKTELAAPAILPWYPGGLAWQLELTRKNVRRSERLFKLHNFLVSETNSGNISRQEAVSMIPPIVLDVQPHHKVLDMCAAPGSKTAQIIEALHNDQSGKLPTGFVIANDIDNNRCYMLVHQAKRLNSPCCLITNTDSSVLPNLFVGDPKTDLKMLKYDRILCDVPCSGDGTMRKNPDIWMKWKVGLGSNLHGVQYRIARRGSELLEIGGRLVYSTCSLNPIENEAVLCRLLRETGDAMEIVDAGHLVENLKYYEGLSYWEPFWKDQGFFKKWEDVPANFHTVVRPEMFPPTPEEAEKFNIKRCMRILPHLQNTGGFFVAVLEKKKQLPWESEIAEKALKSYLKRSQEAPTDAPAEPTVDTPPRKKKRIPYGFKEDPFVFFEETEEIFASLKDFYELNDDFIPQNLLTRCKVGKKKNVYFVSEAIRNIIQNNEKNIKLINSGVKTFSRCDNRNMSCSFRLAHEGLNNIDIFVGTNRRLVLEKSDIILLLNNTDPLNAPEQVDLSKKAQMQLEGFGSGSCIVIYQEEHLKLKFVGWKGTKTLRAYVDQNDAVHMLRLLGADISKYEKNKFVARGANGNGENSEIVENDDSLETSDSGSIEEPEVAETVEEPEVAEIVDKPETVKTVTEPEPKPEVVEN